MSKARIKTSQWLLLLQQLPTKSETARVRIWRSLQKIGAVSVKNSVYALPDTKRFREAFFAIAKEIEAAGGNVVLTEGKFLLGLDPKQLEQAYNQTLDGAFSALANEIRRETKATPVKLSASELMRWDHKKTKFVSLFKDLSEKNLFHAEGEHVCKSAFKNFESRLTSVSDQRPIRQSKKIRPKGATWVTRKSPKVDRLASAWLIKRHVDSKAKFLFVDIDRYSLEPGHLRYDVHDGEFTHVGDKCTFEVLLEYFQLNSPALRALGEVIHDLDIKDAKYERPETEGLRLAIDGLIRSWEDDHERLDSAINLFDGLERSIGGK